ncbi:MAG: RidA family protein [Phycisphaeraceae bacterium]|nr:RidA family protein [Phycisphaeraceae bacterium]
MMEMSRAPEPVGAYPPCRRVGNLLFISGMGPRRKGSKDIPGVTLDAQGRMIDYDMEAQVRSVFDNIRMVLEDAGARWEDLIDLTCFLTDMPRDFAVYNRVYAELFPEDGNRPCRTTVEIKSLPQAGSAPIAFEVKAVAAMNGL